MNTQQIIEQRILDQHRIIAERLEANPSILDQAKANLVRWAARYKDDELPPWLPEWQALLESPVEDILEILTADTEHAKWLRSCSPFAGVLSARERWLVLKGGDHAQA